MARIIRLIIVVLLLGVSACAAPPRSSFTPAVAIKAGEKVQVLSGETLYSFARRNNVSMRELIDLNRLQAPYDLMVGDTLTLPAKAGNLPAVELGPVAKQLENDYRTKHKGKPVTTYSQVAPVRISEEKAQALAEERVIDQNAMVEKSAAPAFKSQPSELQNDARAQFGQNPPIVKPRYPEKNNPASALNLQPLHFDKASKQLKAASSAKPSVAIEVPEKTIPEKNASGKKSKIVSGKPDPNDDDIPVAKATPRVPPQLKPIEEEKPLAKTEIKKKEPELHSRIEKARDPLNFVWPVQGSVLSTFGPKSNGLKNDGINIGAPRGAPVVAADGGTVAYAGSDIPGYGNVVLVRHPSGLMTTYAHLDRMYVQQDVVVAKGDVVGSVGTSGGLDTPQLHFEIRRDKEALDPSKYLYR